METSEQQPFANYQYEIYLAGLAGQRPAYPLTYGQMQKEARRRLPAEAYGYVAGSAGSEGTARSNLEAFHRWRIVPRMLRDVSEVKLSTTILGTAASAPLLLAPIGVQTIVHPDGELASARAAAALGVPFVASGLALGRLSGVFGWVKRHYAVINGLAGILLITIGILVITGELQVLNSKAQDFLDGLNLNFFQDV